jgi:hypothetical protein
LNACLDVEYSVVVARFIRALIRVCCLLGCVGHSVYPSYSLVKVKLRSVLHGPEWSILQRLDIQDCFVEWMLPHVIDMFGYTECAKADYVESGLVALLQMVASVSYPQSQNKLGASLAVPVLLFAIASSQTCPMNLKDNNLYLAIKDCWSWLAQELVKPISNAEPNEIRQVDPVSWLMVDRFTNLMKIKGLLNDSSIIEIYHYLDSFRPKQFGRDHPLLLAYRCQNKNRIPFPPPGLFQH